MCCFVYISLILICYFLRKIKKTYCSLLLKKITCCAKRQKKVNCLSQPPPPCKDIKWSVPNARNFDIGNYLRDLDWMSVRTRLNILR